ncbi:phospholipid scramblase 1 isoform X2 [Orussus abietinus]|uniref:phospholipid scramblase 1 isoform X2 n=1 Tax=Orussus abietinus TaxID=222816 RepID=UPI000625014D|nr:phospholipid scramblase 1 isoform X2 [Orussus abietinus]XP_012284662.1 phospholipid scramblase 1 isoform X2 [Orussus abietinus]XP_012284663.1 phospholipid scramblase 1 isoform X2 [Orussus abietinus]XP_012284665.1 phospholipid scramblase 1 isoform X2 [Orussus abietinus]
MRRGGTERRRSTPGSSRRRSKGGWPAPSMSCPPGLEFLTTLDQLFVDQKVEVLEAFTGWETENRYVVKDIRGMPVYYVSEDSNVCSRCFCGKYRPCEIKVADNSRKEVLRFSRPLRCASCWCPCLLQELEVYSNGIPIGSVVQNWNPLRPSFDILDATGDTVLQIRGPICILCCDVNFEVKSRDGDRRVGRISKKWSGIGREFFTDSDLFGISFPGDLDVKVKAVLLGACILIDFMYFEGNKKAEL